MNKKYLSTRGGQHDINASEGIISGLAADGGLFVPEFLDDIHLDLTALTGADYTTVAKAVFSEFLNDFSEEQIDACVTAAYGSGKFDGDCPVALKKIDDRHFLELYHGPTCAFKDMALTILPHLMTTSLAIQDIHKRILILTATSGDTGKAALSGFANVDGIDIVFGGPKQNSGEVDEKNDIVVCGRNIYLPKPAGDAKVRGRAWLETREGEKLGPCEVMLSGNDNLCLRLRLDAPLRVRDCRLAIETCGTKNAALDPTSPISLYRRNVRFVGEVQ